MQSLSRIAARFAKPLICAMTSSQSRVTAGAVGQCRRFTTGRDYIRYGSMEDSVTQDIKLLDPILGTWEEISAVNYAEFLRKIGFKPEFVQAMTSIKIRLVFARNGDVWKVSHRRSDTHEWHDDEFILDESFDDEFIVDNWKMVAVKYQDGNKLRERYQTTDPPRRIITVLNEIKDDNLIVTSRYKDVVTVRTFKRIAN